MYLPYVRGKQFELIGLREFYNIKVNPSKISPILEPIKEINTLFKKSLESCLATGTGINFILNPKAGSKNSGVRSDLVEYCNSIQGDNQFIPTFIIITPTDLEYAASIIKEHYNNRSYSLIHKARLSNESLLPNFFHECPNVKLNVIDSSCGTRYSRFVPKGTVVRLSDAFVSESRNAAYLTKEEQIFTEEHLYYKEEGNIGFSDYLTIGEDFTEGGFLPYAVAIHLTYQNLEDRKIWIKHFVSDSNEDYSDPAGKFGEALQKLVNFVEEMGLNTYGTRQFKELYNNNSYPGLGVIKKLSILNHIELVQSLM